MVKRQTWFLVAVFVVLIGLATVWTSYQNNYRQSHPTPSATPTQYLFAFDEASVSSLKIVSNVDGKTVSIGRDANGQWSLVEPKADYTDIANVEAAVTQLASLKVLTTLDSSVNLADFGLDKPLYTITIGINGGQQYIAQIGNSTATSNGYYVLSPGGLPEIVTKTSLDAVLKLWQNPPIATATATPTPSPVITSTVGAITTLSLATMTPTAQPALTNTPAPTVTTAPVLPTELPQMTTTPMVATSTETPGP